MCSIFSSEGSKLIWTKSRKFRIEREGKFAKDNVFLLLSTPLNSFLLAGIPETTNGLIPSVEAEKFGSAQKIR